MNSSLPTANDNANSFGGSKTTLLPIAVGLGLYALLVLYPAFVGLHYIYAAVLPSLTQIIAIIGCAVCFMAFAYRQMTQLSPPKPEQEET